MSQTTIDLKDITAIVEDGLKKNTEMIQKEIKEGNAQTLKAATEALEEARKASLSEVDAKKAELQKDYDKFLAAVKESQQKPNDGKLLTFEQSFVKTLKDGAFDGIKNAIKEGSINGHTIQMKAFGTDQFTDYEAFNTDYREPIYRLYDQFHWRNIIPAGSTSNEFISFPRESTLTGNANAWAYGTGGGGATVAKPAMTPTFAPYTAKVEWIAGIVKAIEVSMLEDFGWASTFLARLLREELMKAEDNQILNGNGTSPQLDGILANAVAYNGTANYTAKIDRIVDAAFRQLADVFLQADTVVMSNADKVSIILNKTSGSGEYNLPEGATGFVNGQLTIAGLRAFSTPQLSAGTAIVGDFTQAMLAIRSAPRLRIFDQNEDDATKNYLMMRIEERIALAIMRANAFVEIDFNAS